jgi:hypothetical protein
VTGSIISASAAAVAAIITAWFAFRAKRIDAASPASVAGGYTMLVADLQEAIERMRVRSVEVEAMLVSFRAAAEKAIEAEQRCLLRLASMEKEVRALRERLETLEDDA